MVDNSSIDSICTHYCVFRVDGDIPESLVVLVLVERLGNNLGVPRWDLVYQPTLSQDQSKNRILSAELCLDMYFVCAREEQPASS